MTNMTAMPLYRKNLKKNILLWNQKADNLETWYATLGTRVLPSLFKYRSRVDLDLFYGKVKFVLSSKLVDAVNLMSTWTYMNIKDQGHSLSLVQDHSDSTFSSSFSFETAKLSEAKFHVEPPWDEKWKWVQMVYVTWPRWAPCRY